MFFLMPSLLLAQSPEIASRGLGNVEAGEAFHALSVFPQNESFRETVVASKIVY